MMVMTIRERPNVERYEENRCSNQSKRLQQTILNMCSTLESAMSDDELTMILWVQKI